MPQPPVNPQTEPADRQDGNLPDLRTGRPGRRRNTLILLVFQYILIGVTIVRGIVMVPLYLHYIALSLYGAWLASGNIVSWIALAEGGAGVLIQQQVATFYGRGERRDLSQTVGTGLAILTVLSLLATAIGLALLPWVPAVFHMTGSDAVQLSWAFLLAVLDGFLSMLSGGPYAVQQGLQRSFLTNLVAVLCELASLASTIVLLVTGWGLLAIPMGLIVRDLLNNLFLWALMSRSLLQLKVRIAFSRAKLWTLSRLMGWTWLNRTGQSLMSSIDAFMVSAFLGNEMVAIAVLTRRGWDTLMMFLNRIGVAFTPSMSHLAGAGEAEKFRSVMSRMLCVLGMLMGMGLALLYAFNKSFVTVWVGPTLFAGEWYNLILGAGTMLLVAVFTICQLMLASGNIRGSAIAQISQIALWIGLQAILLPTIGLIGLPISMLAASLTVFVFYVGRQAARLMTAPGESGWPMFLRIMKYFAVAAVLAGLLVLADQFSIVPLPASWAMLAAQVAAGAILFAIALYILDTAAREQISLLLAAVSRRVPRRA
jgi:O-antigen/teichoic acid export membrane protein